MGLSPASLEAELPSLLFSGSVLGAVFVGRCHAMPAFPMLSPHEGVQLSLPVLLEWPYGSWRW